MYYAQTQNSFEEICLKYLELGDMTALRTFLTYKLNELDSEEVSYLKKKEKIMKFLSHYTF